MYLHRAIETTILKAEHQTKAILITGARQGGKSTTIRELYPGYTYITLDDENYAALARNDSTLFFRDIKYPVIIDEAQYALNCYVQSRESLTQTTRKANSTLPALSLMSS